MGPRAAAMAVLALLVALGLPGEGARDDAVLDLPPVLRVSPEAAEALGWPAVLRHAAEVPVTAVVPGRPPPVLLDPPSRLRAGRTAAIRAHANERVRVTLDRPEGTRDTLALRAGGASAFLLRPLSGGWRTWRIEVQGVDGAVLQTEWSALVEPARPLRILAISGPPDPESDMALRTLEEAGEQVEAWIHLGRDVWVGREGGPLPDESAAYAEVDVIVLFPGFALDPPGALALVDAVRERGKGLLLAATDGGAPGTRDVVASLLGEARWQRTAAVPADSLAWSVPPEIPPLPSAPVTASVRVGDAAGADTSRPSPLRLTALGRGRVGALALADTWRWRMVAGASDAHRELWQGIVSWLADGFAEDPVLDALGAGHRAGSPVYVRRLDAPHGSVYGGPEGALESSAPAITVSGPEGTRSLALTPLGTTPAGQASLGAFVPTERGAYVARATTEGAAGSPSPALGVAVLDPAAPDLDPAGRLARIAAASPGGSIVLNNAGGIVDERATDARALPWRAGLFAVLALLLTGAWLRRRLSALP